MTDHLVDLSLAREHVAALEKEIADEARRALEAEHLQAVVQCRASRDETMRLRAEVDRLKRQFIKKKGALDNARRLLAEWRESKPLPASYPTAEAYDEWHAELIARQSTASEAERTYGDAWREYQLARAGWATAKEAFDLLADQESALRSQLQPPKRSGIEITVFDGTEGVRLYRV